jgi:hypothetical protein
MQPIKMSGTLFGGERDITHHVPGTKIAGLPQHTLKTELLIGVQLQK